MQQIVNFLIKTVYIKIMLLDKYLVLISYKIPSFKYSSPKIILDPQVNFLHFLQFKGTPSEDTKQTLF